MKKLLVSLLILIIAGLAITPAALSTAEELNPKASPADQKVRVLNETAGPINFAVAEKTNPPLVTAEVPKTTIWLVLAICSIFIALIEITRLVRYLKRNNTEPEFHHVLDI